MKPSRIRALVGLWSVVAGILGSPFDACLAAESPSVSLPSASELKPQLVSFPSSSLTLHGFLYQPEGTAPFPAVLWNHGSEKLPGARGELARFYTSKGYVFFVPHRHGHGRSPGDYIVDLQAKAKAAAKDASEFHRKVLGLHELYLEDTIAAATWLKQQSFVDTNRLVMSGVSYGGIQTVLAAERDLGIKAYVPFAPGAMSWQGLPELHDRLLQAVKHTHAPMFLLQAENDYNLGPSEV
jgi:dienelactone hydrolase